MHHHKWMLSDIEDLMPWERDIYVELLNMEIEKKNIEMAAQQQK